MARYLTMNDKNWRRLCRREVKYEQQKMKLGDNEQIQFNLKYKEIEKSVRQK